jgi:hypothetical protein
MYLIAELSIHDFESVLGGQKDSLLVDMYVLVIVVVEDNEIADESLKDAENLFLCKMPFTVQV